MKMKIFTLILATLLLVSCTDNAIDSSVQPETDPIQIGGALNTTFKSSQSLLNKKITGDREDLYISVQGTDEKNDFWQRISLKFETKIEGAGNLRSGDVFEISEQSPLNKINYQSHWDESTYTDLLFEIDGGKIRIDHTEDGNLVGRFKLWAHQSAGRRMTYGQVEDLVLSNQGEISVSGVFSIIIR